MNIITSNVQVQLTQEEKNKLQDAREVISHLFDLMYDYEQEYAISNIGEEYSMSQVRDTSNLLAALIGSDKMRLENKYINVGEIPHFLLTNSLISAIMSTTKQGRAKK